MHQSRWSWGRPKCKSSAAVDYRVDQDNISQHEVRQSQSAMYTRSTLAGPETNPNGESAVRNLNLTTPIHQEEQEHSIDAIGVIQPVATHRRHRRLPLGACRAPSPIGSVEDISAGGRLPYSRSHYTNIYRPETSPTPSDSGAYGTDQEVQAYSFFRGTTSIEDVPQELEVLLFTVRKS